MIGKGQAAKIDSRQTGERCRLSIRYLWLFVFEQAVTLSNEDSPRRLGRGSQKPLENQAFGAGDVVV